VNVFNSFSTICPSIIGLVRSCVCCVAAAGLISNSASVLHASDQLRLTISGGLIVGQLAVPPGPTLDETLGLSAGDAVSLIFDFDSSILIAPGLPGAPQFGAIDLDRFEAQIGALNFQGDSTNVGVEVFELGNSGLNFIANLFGDLPETTQSDLSLSSFNSAQTLFSLETGDIPGFFFSSGRFPDNLSTANIDFDRFVSGSLSLSQPGSDFSNALGIDLTSVTVTSVPEPSSIVIMLITVIASATRRRRHPV